MSFASVLIWNLRSHSEKMYTDIIQLLILAAKRVFSSLTTVWTNWVTRTTKAVHVIEKDSGAPDNEGDLTEVVVLTQAELVVPKNCFCWNTSLPSKNWVSQYYAVEHLRQTIKHNPLYVQSYSHLYVHLSCAFVLV